MLNRYYLPQELAAGASVALEGDELHHAARVHRSRVGQEVELFDGRGHGVVASITAITPSRMTLTVLREVPDLREPRARVTLGLALIQPEKFELVLQKGTEMGVAEFVPVISEHTEVRPERVAGKRERWEKILLEAAKQCGATRLPSLAEVMSLDEALAGAQRLIVLDPSGESPFQRLEAGTDSRLFIGPEGGWSDSEITLARSRGASVATLGERRLRAETAAIAAAAVALL